MPFVPFYTVSINKLIISTVSLAQKTTFYANLGFAFKAESLYFCVTLFAFTNKPHSSPGTLPVVNLMVYM